MKKFIAFSGGVESSAMCILFGKEATPIFADTKFEHKEMYERIGLVEKVLKIIHGEDFEIIRVCNAKEGLPEYIRRHKFYPSPVARFCTRVFKIEPIDKFLSKQGDCELLIGLNADEADDREGNYGLCKNVTYTYPLIDLGMSRRDCEVLLMEHGLMPEFPSYMKRGGVHRLLFQV